VLHVHQDELRIRDYPIAKRRWGFPASGRNEFGAVAMVAILVVIVATALSGCRVATTPVYDGPQSWSYDAPADSLGLRDFLALSSSEQAHRRDQAATWKIRAQRSRLLAEKIHALNNAAGTAPDNAETWLALAELGRWVGDYVQTIVWLDNAAEAVRALGAAGGNGPEDLTSAHWLSARRTGLLRGWVHSDRAEWREGLTWVNALARQSAGDASIMRLRGVLAGGAANRTLALRMAEGLERANPFDTYGSWIRASLDRSRGLHSEALNYVIGLRPDTDHAAECWREMGEVAEMQEEDSHARRYYRESFHSLPLNDKSPLQKMTYSRLGDGRYSRELEFWLAFDRYYVTGSLSAYTNYAGDCYAAASDPQQRVFWAGQTVNGAGILLRKEMDQAWALRLRGLVFVETDELEKGLRDLRRCSRLLQESGHADALVEAGLGRLLLKKERHDQALPHLRRAVDLDSQNAEAWADLGLCLVMTSDVVGAESALDRSLRLNPNSATAWYNRGVMRLRAGQFVQAESDLKEAARLAPGNAEVVKLLQRAHVLQQNRTRKKTRE
jgi:tetratricopeptide (TPR) repeat protein